MLFLVVKLLINASVLMLMPSFISGISISNFYYAVIAALVLGIINVTIKPLLKLLTLPITLLTFGLFTLVINAVLFWFVSTFIQGFEVAGVWPAFWGALVLSIVSFLLGMGKK